MQSGFSDDQTQLRDAVGRFLADKSPPEAVRRWMASDSGYDPDVWRQLCRDVGLAGTHIGEAYGGHGLGAVELGIVAEQMGRHVYCGPFFGSAVMAGYALMGVAHEEHKERLLPEIAAGTSLAALVLDDLNAPERVGRSVRAVGARAMVLNGSAPAVVDAQVADRLIVVAGGGGGLRLCDVRADADGVRVEPRESLDATRRLSRVTFQEAAAEPIGVLNGAALESLWDRMCVALAHEMLGGAQALLESTVEYTAARVQFGRLIGSFQALKHRCADLLLEVELAGAAVHHAARCLDAGGDDAHAPNMAKSMANEAYMSAARTAIQLRGGIGFTWEDDTHLWFKRAKSSEVLLGDTRWHRERMMARIEEAAAHA